MVSFCLVLVFFSALFRWFWGGFFFLLLTHVMHVLGLDE